MGSLDTNGQPIAQSSKIIKNLGNEIIEVSDHSRDELVRKISGFSLDKIPGLLLWMDASDYSTFVIDENVRIASWSDKSSNDFGPFTQDTAGSRPFYVSSAFNSGKPGMQNSSGQNTSLFINSPLFTDYPVTIFIAARSNDATIDGAILWIGDKDTNGQDRVSIRFVGGTSQGDSADILTTVGGVSVQTSTIGRTSFIATAPNVVTVKLESSVLRTISLNRGPVVENRQALQIQNFDRTVLGRELDTTPTNTLSGFIHEIVVYDSILSDSSVRAVEEYLANKWGVSLDG